MQVGGRLSDIGHAVQEWVEAHGFSVVREFVGHGIGEQLHEEPQIPNYGQPGRGPKLAEGMVLAIEPMVAMGRPETQVLADGWTAVTRDGSLAAHFEHTVAVTTDGPLVLTARERRGRRGARRSQRQCRSSSTSAVGVSRRRCSRVLPRALYRVAVDGGREVVAHAAVGTGTEFRPAGRRRSGDGGAEAARRDARADRRGAAAEAASRGLSEETES